MLEKGHLHGGPRILVIISMTGGIRGITSIARNGVKGAFAALEKTTNETTKMTEQRDAIVVIAAVKDTTTAAREIVAFRIRKMGIV